MRPQGWLSLFSERGLFRKLTASFGFIFYHALTEFWNETKFQLGF
jgi:hypothetical protein